MIRIAGRPGTVLAASIMLFRILSRRHTCTPAGASSALSPHSFLPTVARNSPPRCLSQPSWCGISTQMDRPPPAWHNGEGLHVPCDLGTISVRSRYDLGATCSVTWPTLDARSPCDPLARMNFALSRVVKWHTSSSLLLSLFVSYLHVLSNSSAVKRPAVSIEISGSAMERSCILRACA